MRTLQGSGQGMYKSSRSEELTRLYFAAGHMLLIDRQTLIVSPCVGNGEWKQAINVGGAVTQ